MDQIIIKLKDQSKRKFLLKLLAQFNFIEIKIKHATEKKSDTSYDFFQSAGLFADREIDSTSLRKNAWRIRK